LTFSISFFLWHFQSSIPLVVDVLPGWSGILRRRGF
jgi:hypothetical protein